MRGVLTLVTSILSLIGMSDRLADVPRQSEDLRSKFLTVEADNASPVASMFRLPESDLRFLAEQLEIAGPDGIVDKIIEVSRLQHRVHDAIYFEMNQQSHEYSLDEAIARLHPKRRAFIDANEVLSQTSFNGVDGYFFNCGNTVTRHIASMRIAGFDVIADALDGAVAELPTDDSGKPAFDRCLEEEIRENLSKYNERVWDNNGRQDERLGALMLAEPELFFTLMNPHYSSELYKLKWRE